MSTVHTAVAVMIDRSISEVELIHEIHYLVDSFWIVSCISINLDIEDMSTTGEVMVRSFNLCLMAHAALVIDWHMVGIGVIVLVGHTLDDAVAFLVDTSETS